jgi:hypothetical protein
MQFTEIAEITRTYTGHTGTLMKSRPRSLFFVPFVFFVFPVDTRHTCGRH